jgi:2,4-dienoyl-CoA reductase (NADPH2)
MQRKQPKPGREITLLQRKAGKHGANLGKTTGWIHRAVLKMNKVQMIADVNYERIGDEGLLISYADKRENPTWIDVDNIVMCAGQVALRELEEPLQSAGIKTHVIGGADVASELDAKRAIDQGSRIAARL